MSGFQSPSNDLEIPTIKTVCGAKDAADAWITIVNLIAGTLKK
jgi:hypothetical protein